jgi:hypothetical protein
LLELQLVVAPAAGMAPARALAAPAAATATTPLSDHASGLETTELHAKEIMVAAGTTGPQAQEQVVAVEQVLLVERPQQTTTLELALQVMAAPEFCLASTTLTTVAVAVAERNQIPALSLWVVPVEALTQLLPVLQTEEQTILVVVVAVVVLVLVDLVGQVLSSWHTSEHSVVRAAL